MPNPEFILSSPNLVMPNGVEQIAIFMKDFIKGISRIDISYITDTRLWDEIPDSAYIQFLNKETALYNTSRDAGPSAPRDPQFFWRFPKPCTKRLPILRNLGNNRPRRWYPSTLLVEDEQTLINFF